MSARRRHVAGTPPERRDFQFNFVGGANEGPILNPRLSHASDKRHDAAPRLGAALPRRERRRGRYFQRLATPSSLLLEEDAD